MTGSVNGSSPTHTLRDGHSALNMINILFALFLNILFAFFHTYIKEQTAVQILPFCYLTAFAENSSRKRYWHIERRKGRSEHVRPKLRKWA